jgi:copper(I)-binding protein
LTRAAGGATGVPDFRRFRMRHLIAAAVAGVFLLAAGAASAADVDVSGAWIRTTPPGAVTAAAYATIANHGFSDRLIDGRTVVAASVIPHQMLMTGGVMRMRPIVGGLGLSASQTVTLGPNGDHLMLLGLKQPLKAGQHVKIILDFKRAGAVPVDFLVRDTAPGGMFGMHM